MSAKYAESHTWSRQLDLHFTHQTQCTMLRINTFLVCEYICYLYICYIHILETSKVLENKFISILFLPVSHTDTTQF